MLSVANKPIILSVTNKLIMLNVINAENPYAECHRLSVLMLNVFYAKCRKQAHYAECH